MRGGGREGLGNSTHLLVGSVVSPLTTNPVETESRRLWGAGMSCMAGVCKTIDPRIPTVSGRSTWGFHPPGKHCLHQGRSAVVCSASSVKGELHPTKNRS